MLPSFSEFNTVTNLPKSYGNIATSPLTLTASSYYDPFSKIIPTRLPQQLRIGSWSVGTMSRNFTLHLHPIWKEWRCLSLSFLILGKILRVLGVVCKLLRRVGKGKGRCSMVSNLSFPIASNLEKQGLTYCNSFDRSSSCLDELSLSPID